MKRDVLSSRPEEAVGALCDRMQAAHVHCAPVTDDEGTLLGIVSTEDLLFGGVFGLPPGAHAEPRVRTDESRMPTVSEVMTAPALSIPEHAGVRDVAALMWAHRIHHLPVVDADERLCGIVSSLDLCRVVLQNQPQDTP
jgi:CBS domain-containing membrane protein